ncbi:hypothetical protein AgCh_024973 [Apium graveolens]
MPRRPVRQTHVPAPTGPGSSKWPIVISSSPSRENPSDSDSSDSERPSDVVTEEMYLVAGAPHGNVLGRITPLSNNSCSWLANSLISAGAILYGAFETGFVPGAWLILNSIFRSGGKPGSSSGNTSGNLLTTGMSYMLRLSLSESNT